MRSITLLLLLAVAIKAPAQRNSWSIGEAPVGKAIDRLPAKDQRAIVPTLDRELQTLLKNDGLEAEDMPKARANLHALRIPAGSSSLFLVQGWDVPLCSGTGNCYLWVLDASGRVLLASRGNGIALLKHTGDHLPLVEVFSHHSSSDTGIERWRFRSAQYDREWCGVSSWGNSWDHWKKPQVQGGPCDGTRE
jgi:hypothetical protein